jgi:hypothetical protein
MTLPVSIDGAAAVRVPIGQVAAAAARLSHIPRLHGRMTTAVKARSELALTESEALLILAEIRRRPDVLARPLDQLVDALFGRRPHDVTAHIGGLEPEAA